MDAATAARKKSRKSGAKKKGKGSLPAGHDTAVPIDVDADESVQALDVNTDGSHIGRTGGEPVEGEAIDGEEDDDDDEEGPIVCCCLVAIFICALK